MRAARSAPSTCRYCCYCCYCSCSIALNCLQTFRRALRNYYVQVNFSYVAPTQNPLRPDDEFAPACVQFVTNGSRWTEEGCQCLNRMCSECNCSYAEVRSATAEGFSREPMEARRRSRQCRKANNTCLSVALQLPASNEFCHTRRRWRRWKRLSSKTRTAPHRRKGKSGVVGKSMV